ncbi:GNAT family N-acetyltransferase [Fusobacterium sp. IOR10]|uniref:GNAT family N-acetyltransferase n=1 Tax=Fusobacterium sp. IOR10 TaxID=2665157 RepID=UPI00193FA58E|nr:GNAT family protein [Fusobacterium sp. IOR10]
MNIEGKLVTLRAIEKEDLEFMRTMLNDSEMENLVVGWAFPVSKYQQEKWYENNIQNQNNLRFIIEDKFGEVIGQANLSNIDWKNRKATRGIKLAKEKIRGKGFGTDAIMTLTKYAFEELQLNRLDIFILEENIVSQKLAIKTGVVIEGKKRNCIFKNGKYHNLLIGGILKSDYKKLIEKNNYWKD